MRSKTAGLVDAILQAPLSGVAAAMSANSGQRAQAGALGAVLGAGMAAMADREQQQREQQGLPSSPEHLSPVIKAILAAVAAGGGLRALSEQRDQGHIGTGTAILAGVPVGALLYPGHPILGGLVGSVAGPMIAHAIGRPRQLEADNPIVRAEAAQMAAMARLDVARKILMARFNYLQRQIAQVGRHLDRPLTGASI